MWLGVTGGVLMIASGALHTVAGWPLGPECEIADPSAPS